MIDDAAVLIARILRAIVVAGLVIVCGCGDRIVEQRVIRRWQSEGRISCSYTCLSIDWETGGPQLDSCNGHQQAILEFAEIETTYETDDGRAEKSHRKELRIDQRVVRSLDGCR